MKGTILCSINAAVHVCTCAVAVAASAQHRLLGRHLLPRLVPAACTGCPTALLKLHSIFGFKVCVPATKLAIQALHVGSPGG